ncbi:conserved hypothetical integral membrane protein [Tistlia consotensis]|uniref:Conserved hypothetical integral membrane protein n=1 Tax=Tistlia consotensis USBA 355 TaxID=560819 RepID=A0A1Y6B5T7_9PROT|nr:YeiH family protein [Tistlia consotensis]SME93798.1 conserved hypothetical integral membrane protein [Tistlia consotensis USBA 355]SNR28813.1 conserved hypothetical integral membrane protein [Tistlia consotensis]
MSAIAREQSQKVPPLGGLAGIAPGLVLTGLVAALAFGLHRLPVIGTLSPLILATLVGMAFHNLVGTPGRAKAGIAFTLRRILRLAIILLGLQLTAAQVAEVGAPGIAVIVVVLFSTFVFTTWAGRRLGVERKLAELIAAGTSICGASAVIATNTVTGASDEDVAYAVACVTLFGTVAMFAYPLLPGLLHLDPQAFGLWAGSSIHEIAQVVAAAFQNGPASGQFGTVAKLSRVMMLAPVVLGLGLLAARRARAAGGAQGDRGHSHARAPIPWFAFGFIAMVVLNSLVTVPAEAKSVIVPVTTFLLSMALAAMGLATDFRKLREKGLRPALLGLGAFLFIASFSLLLVEVVL